MSKKELLQKMFGGLSPEWRVKTEAKVIAAVGNRRVVKSLNTAELMAVAIRIGDLRMLGRLNDTLNPPQGDLL